MTQTLDALIVGAGFSGLYMLHKLRQDGFSAQVVEKGSGVGGTWFWNRYPGARCDIPSVEYSYSFDPQLEQDWVWTERYASQPEILSYLEHVAERYDLTRDIAFNTRVTAARWDDDRARWQVETDTGASFEVQFMILATGALSEPKLPDMPGLDSFAGPIVFTSQWDDSVDLAGKAVCHFGTGSSGIQAVAALSKIVDRLTVFQRTPSYAVPANNRPLPAEELAAIKADYAALRAAQRANPLSFGEWPMPGSSSDFDEEGLAARLEEAWNGGTFGLMLAFEDVLFNLDSNAAAAAYGRAKIAQQVDDPEMARKLTPDYPLGSRRMCAEIGFYEALNQPHVDLVDVREEKVVEITADAVITDKGRYPADVITLATGFNACVGAIKAIDLHGKDGRAITDEWAMGPRTYLGLAVEGFPNLFTITGPGSPSVLSNVVVSIEQHVDWIARCMADMRKNGERSIEATSAAEREWMDHADELAQQTVFPLSKSWYQGRTADGRTVFMPYVGGTNVYRDKCDDVAAKGYEGFALN